MNIIKTNLSQKEPAMNAETVYRVDNAETVKIKHYALETLRADLVGIANIGRFAGAPVKMSPQGVMPSARSVIVMAIHHPDAAIELGGKKHPQEIGPYQIQYHMNWRLDDMSYRMSNFLEKLGWNAVPIVSSNIWRYRGYKDLKEQFAPDVSHIHSAVAAGLAEYGYSGLAITPEFGARVRFVTVVTDAELTPSPLLEPGSVCDSCMICKRECRSGALSKEIKGWNVIEYEGRQYRYANKNLWRCSWGEHFDLDLDLPIPDVVDEKVIMEATVKYGRRGGEMGSCLRYCLPKALRYWDRDYTNTPRRRRRYIENPEVQGAVPRGLFEEIRALGGGWGVDHVVVRSADELRESSGIDIGALMPGAIRSVSMVSMRRPLSLCDGIPNRERNQPDAAWSPIMTQAGYDAVRLLEKFGYSACQYLNFPEETFAASLTGAPGMEIRTLTLLTDAPLPLTGSELPFSARRNGPPRELTDRLEEEARLRECDLFGVAPAERLAAIVPDLKAIFEGEVEYVGRNKADSFHKPYDPVVTKEARRVCGPADYLPGAKSVIVIGLRMPKATVDITARTPAEAAGPYVFAQYETIMRLRVAAWNLTGLLEAAGYRGVYTLDLHNTGSVCMNPRGEYPDVFSNAFAAVGAGLGALSLCGSVVNPRFGSNMRYVAIVTDAELVPNEVLKSVELGCAGCSGNCFSACKTAAFQPEVHEIVLGGVPQRFRKFDVNRCNWAKRYSLVGSEGNQYTGWHLDLAYPEQLNEETLADALRQLPHIEKIRPCNFEQCVLACPHARKQ